jgi:uncharacterized damage-inducible protein DinB
MTRSFRTGAVGALLDEYERAAGDLARVLAGLDDGAFSRLRDAETTDEDCRSIQTVMRHVVRAGYGYADYLRSAFSMPSERPEVPLAASHAEAADRLREMLRYTEATLEGRWLMTDEEITAVRVESRWGPVYDLEQLLEHAIVHVLRHRRQIERFLFDPRFA